MADIPNSKQIITLLCDQTDNEIEIENIYSSSYRYAEYLSYFDPYLSQEKPLKILDLGTGKGWMSLLIKRLYPQHIVTATDVDVNERVRSRLENEGVTVISGCKFVNGRQLPLESDCYDVCLFLEALEHIIEEPRYIFSETNRITKPGGLILFTTPNMAYLFNRLLLLFGVQPQFYLTGLRHGTAMPRNHIREWTMVELIMLLEGAGFVIIDKRFFYGHGGLGAAKKKLYLKFLFYTFKLLLMAVPSFRGDIAIAARKPS